MRNLEYVFCTLVGISSIPNTLLAGQAQPRKKPINKQQPNIILIYCCPLKLFEPKN